MFKAKIKVEQNRQRIKLSYYKHEKSVRSLEIHIRIYMYTLPKQFYNDNSEENGKELI